MKRAKREEPVRRNVRNIVLQSRNRLYMDSLLEKEIDETMELLLVRCKQLNKEPIQLLRRIENKMIRMPNLAFCQALAIVLELKNITNWGITGWQPKIKRVRRN